MNQDSEIPRPPQFPEFNWRALSLHDASALNWLLAEIEKVDHYGQVDTVADLEQQLIDPETNLETDTILGCNEASQALAFGWVFTPPASTLAHLVFLWCEVHPDYQNSGIEDFIFRWLEVRGRQILAGRPEDLPHELMTQCWDKRAWRIELLGKQGFQTVRSYYQMQCRLEEQIPDPALPDGITLVNWAPELDDQVLEAFNLAFRDHWGFFPSSREIWQLYSSGDNKFRPHLSFVALAEEPRGESRVVGFAVNQERPAFQQPDQVREGWVQELGVLREWRQRGLGTALLAKSLQAFQNAGCEFAGLGVDTDNLTGALRIYERLGFKPVRRILAFSKRV